jgi:tripartite-type tricarboxylate transporter receptor subunit TctC
MRHVLGLLLTLTFAGALAQPYPSRPIRIVAPFPASGGVDLAARVVGQKLSERFGTSVVIDNRPGAGGMLGTDIVAKAPADGHSLLLASGSHAINPVLHRRLPYDAVRDFAAVALVVTAPSIVTVTPSLGTRTLKDFLELARAKPGQLAFASPGTGTPPHLAIELLKSAAGVDFVHVPYKGAAEFLPDLVSGRVAAGISAIPTVLTLVQLGKLQPLAVTTRTRSRALPSVPTISEGGVPDYDAASWYALLAPANTPHAVLERLNHEVVQILRADDVRERLGAQGLEATGSTRQELATRIREDITKWQRVVKAAGIKVE